jgi:hypothetical protein
MSETLEKVRALMLRGEIHISLHGYEELAADDIRVRDAIASLGNALVIEDYPNYPKGPCVLVLEYDAEERPIHVVWGIPAGKTTPAVLITAYRPSPEKWSDGWQRRRRE